MRFLHTSDWHLGRIFHGIHLTSDQAYVLEQFVKLVGDTNPDAVLIAGDVYDRSVPPTEAVQLLDETLSRILIDHRVPVILIAGNHDSPERLGFGAGLLSRQGLHLAGLPDKNLAPVVLYDDSGPVYFCPLPYAEPPVVRHLLSAPEANGHDRAMRCLSQHLARQVPHGTRAVSLAHAFAAGGEECDSERFLTVGGSGTVNVSCFEPFHYTALGHLHRPQQAGARHIRYAGSLLKYSFSEATHQKSVTLVEMDHAGRTGVETVPLTPQRDVRCLEGYLDEILAGPQNGENRYDYLMVTLKDTGVVYDAIGRLREVYPHVLHINRPHLAASGGELPGLPGEHRRLGEMDLFTSFFEQVTGAALSKEQARVFAAAVEELYRKEREVSV